MGRGKDLARLSTAEQRKLLRFVIATAWADLMITPGELAYLEKLMKRLDLAQEETQAVAEWIKAPPQPDEVDPTTIPREHREVFLDTIRGMMKADGEASPEEKESFKLLKRLTR